MKGAILFFIILLLISIISDHTRKKGLNQLKIIRKVEKNHLFPGEIAEVSLSIENHNILPISFIRIEEEYPIQLERTGKFDLEKNRECNIYASYISIGGYERVRVKYNVFCSKRGVYRLKKLNITIGDIFAFGESNKELQSFDEIVVYPTYQAITNFTFNNNSISGDIIVRRWIFEDLQYIKGIREYTINHRMRDIHWNSSSRMNQLMVKEYEHTSDRDIIFILNVQCGEPYWQTINSELIEKGIEILGALGESFFSQGVNPGILTNAQIINFNESKYESLKPGSGSLRNFLEFCARIDINCKMDFYKYLDKVNGTHNSIYIIITPYMDYKIAEKIKRLQEKGATIKIIDTSKKGDIEVSNTEIIHYSWDVT